jgi:methylphosphotriester-DNA--protein-cysteine methyltransferase
VKRAGKLSVALSSCAGVGGALEYAARKTILDLWQEHRSEEAIAAALRISPRQFRRIMKAHAQ